MTLKELVKRLAAKFEQDTEVECIVCTKDGKIVTMLVEGKAWDMTAALKMFSEPQS